MSDRKDGKTVAIYKRASGNGQAEKAGDSLSSQREACQRYAAARGLKVMEPRDGGTRV